MAAVADSTGEMPILDDQGRSVGGFAYISDVYIEITTSAESVDLVIGPSIQYDEGYVLTSVETNNATGYTLYMESDGASLICKTDSGLTISSTSTASSTLDYASWGYQIGTSVSINAWSPAPLSQIQIASNDGPVLTPEDTQVNFAAKDGNTNSTMLTPCSVYTQTITYTATAN